MIDKLGKAVLLFADERTGGHLVGTVIVEGRPGNCFWNLIPIPQDTEQNPGPVTTDAPYRRNSVGFMRGR